MRVATRLSSPKSWHEMPGKRADVTRPVGNGVMRGPKLVHISRRHKRLVPIIPYPTGRIPGDACSRHFMPGYYHSVPSGQ
jgi:hypothetical protein